MSTLTNSYYTTDIINMTTDTHELRASTLTGEVISSTPLETYKVSYFHSILPDVGAPFKSEYELKEWCLEHNLKANNKLHEDINLFFEKTNQKLKVPVQMLIRELKYINVLFIKKSKLKEVLGCKSDSHLSKVLKSLVETQKILYTFKDLELKGDCRITFNPMMVFRGNETARECSYKVWNKVVSPAPKSPYCDFEGAFVQGALQAARDLTPEEVEKYMESYNFEKIVYDLTDFDDPEQFSAYSEWKYPDVQGAKRAYLHCTDLDFSLLLKGLIQPHEAKYF